MSFEKMLKEIDVKQDLKLPFYHLILKGFDQCKKLCLDYKLNSLQLSIITKVETSLNCDKYEAGAHFRYLETGDKHFVAEVAVPKRINSITDLYLIAHEIGHFLNGHSDYFIQGKEKSSRDPFDVEEEADQWAIKFFYGMGIEINEEIMEAIHNNLSIYSKPGEERNVTFYTK